MCTSHSPRVHLAPPQLARVLSMHCYGLYNTQHRTLVCIGLFLEVGALHFWYTVVVTSIFPGDTCVFSWVFMIYQYYGGGSFTLLICMFWIFWIYIFCNSVLCFRDSGYMWWEWYLYDNLLQLIHNVCLCVCGRDLWGRNMIVHLRQFEVSTASARRIHLHTL